MRFLRFLARVFYGAPVQPAFAEAGSGRDVTVAPPVAPREALRGVEVLPEPKPVELQASGKEGGRGLRMTFEGDVITAPDGPLGSLVMDQSRGLCALFSTGVWLVSETHRASPLVTAVEDLARKHGHAVDKPTLVSPEVIPQAYAYARKRQGDKSTGDDSTFKRLVEGLLDQGAAEHASDIHIDTSDGKTIVQLCVDGELKEVARWTQEEGRRAQGFIFNNADVPSGVSNNEREPQTAMLSISTKEGAIALPEGVTGVRCEWTPLVAGGRYLVMRLHYSGHRLLGADGMDLSVLGYTDEQVDILRRSWRTPGGIRFFAAPVNQGKTTTLRVILNNRLAEALYRLNCLMIEDPPEGGVHGARQIAVAAAHGDEKREKTFRQIMRSVLRLAPDILMLGEVRDLESSQFVFRLGLSGRQVFTTLHVYNALAIPQRLRDLGVETYLVYDPSLVHLLVSQRLVRCLCRHCRRPLLEAAGEDPLVKDTARRLVVALARMDQDRKSRLAIGRFDSEEAELPDLSTVFVAGVGTDCDECSGGGTKGRTIVAEVIETDTKLMRYLQEGETDAATDHWLSPDGLNGMPMMWHALEKVRAGILSPVEVEAALGPLVSERERRDFEARNRSMMTAFDAAVGGAR